MSPGEIAGSAAGRLDGASRVLTGSAIWLLLLLTAGCRDAAPTNPASLSSPTILLVCADDLEFATLVHDWQAAGSEGEVKFPTLRNLARQGILFSNLHVTTPVCGPSRACLLSGRYAHRNQVRVNDPEHWISHGFPGGAPAFDPADSLGPWMQTAGYQTCFVGKYLHHGFHPSQQRGETWQSIRPPGWNYFQPSLGARYLDYPVLDDKASQPAQSSGYRTDVEAGDIVQWLEDWDPRQGPQFVCWWPVAPHLDVHGPHMAAERHRSWYRDSEPPDLDARLTCRNPGLPPELDGLPGDGSGQREQILEYWRDRLRATKALDEGLARILGELQRQQRLDNTWIVFTSDHGFQLGQHGHIGKRLPFDPVTRVPTLMVGPGVVPGTCDEILGNIDLAPTLVELAGGQVPAQPGRIDGRSFAALLGNPQGRLDPPREGILLENWEMEPNRDVFLPAMWNAWRTRNHLYTEWATGGREFYDLSVDPGQMDNLYERLPEERRQQLARQLREQRNQDEPPLIATRIERSDHFDEAPVCANFQPVEFSGFAESDHGLQSVSVQVFCPERNEYWNGKDWTTRPTSLDAVLDNPGGITSRWSWQLDTSGEPDRTIGVPRRDVVLTVRATDRAGRQSEWKSPQGLTLHFDDPETWIDTPEELSGGCRPLTLTGRARDNTGVNRVNVVVHNKTIDRFWDGTRWVTGYTALDADLQPGQRPGEVVWSYRLDLSSPDRIFVAGRAVDDSRHYDHSVAFFEFLPVVQPVPAEDP